MMRRFHINLFLCLSLALVAACGGEGGRDPDAPLPLVMADKDLSHAAGSERTEVLIPFTATRKWTVEIADNADWIYPGRSSGEAGQVSLKVTLIANDTPSERSGVLRIVCGSESKEVSFTQEGRADGDDMESDDDRNTLNSADIPDFDRFYKPREFSNILMLKRSAKWSWFRYRQSEHFFVFWEAGFGDDPNAQTVPAALRVDVDDLLRKAEQFYRTNTETLKFAETGQGRSYLDRYKMQIYLLYQTEWLATGAGYDDTIGALWVNPSTCHPVGSTIAHETGHCFQYQVYCDKLLGGTTDDRQQGFRYGYEGSNGGNGFWEQCAQWQSFQDYPAETFGYHADVWLANCHRHFEHEWMRYASYWLPYYWAQKHGVETVGEIWKHSAYPEDAIEAYMRLYCAGSWETMKTELYDYAARMATFDIDAIRAYTGVTVSKYATGLYRTDDGYWQVAYASCPGTTGFNVITLNVPEAGTAVTAGFEGLVPGSTLAADDPGRYLESEKVKGTVGAYNAGVADNAGWRYGFVALKKDGTRTYGDMHQGVRETVHFTVPANTAGLYLVVLGAPAQYNRHPWDEKELNDAQWPYKVKFGGTDPAESAIIP